jgi:hypothetical protein
MESKKLKPNAQKFLDEVTKKISPNFTIKSKSEKSGLYALVSPIIKIFNKDVDENYITVLFGTMWVPSDFYERTDSSSLQILAHETRHEYDRRIYGSVLFSLIYLFPQVLSIFSLLSVLSIWFGPMWLLWLLSLICLAPLPAPGRAYLERNGYRINYIMERWGYGNTNMKPSLDWYTEQFTNSSYYYMFPFKNIVVKQLGDEESIKNDEYNKQVIEFLRNNNLLSINP